MKRHVILDTQEILICDACQLPIPISADKVVFGVGGAAYVKVYHRGCDPEPKLDPNRYATKTPLVKN